MLYITIKDRRIKARHSISILIKSQLKIFLCFSGAFIRFLLLNFIKQVYHKYTFDSLLSQYK